MWPPTITANVSEEEEINHNYPSLKIDPITFKSATKGLIFLKNGKVSNVIAFDETEIPSGFEGTILVKPIKVSSVLYADSLGGSRSVNNKIYCSKCRNYQYYSYYSGPIICENCGNTIM